MDLMNFFRKKTHEKRNIILHFHIFKNAGSTIEWVLEKNFPKKVLSIDGDRPGDTVNMDRIVQEVNKNKSIKAISSHQIRFPISNNTEFSFVPLLFIRHPIDRALSIYYYKRKETDNSIESIKARSLSLQEFIRWNLELKGYMPMKNFQVLFLSRYNTREKVNEKDLEIAVNRMKSCSVLGIVDRIDESLVIAEELLKKYFDEIDLPILAEMSVKNEREIWKRD